jgi:hypothetical protein
MSFRDDNDAYERWLRRKCDVVDKDLKKKHKRMKKDAFVFLRATYFRWAKQIEDVAPELALTRAPSVLSVGDLHLENFGTWRDADGRLVWGINDFDEAAAIPYPFDLVRLATSALLLPGVDVGRHHLATMLDGYRRGLKHPRPTALDEVERWMRPFVAASDHVRNEFWRDIDKLDPADPPAGAKQALIESLPEGYAEVSFGSWVKGGGSLGRPRFVAVAEWRGGRIVREAKALLPSAWDWAHDRPDAASRFQEVADGLYRAPDPFLKARPDGKWIVRRVAADSRKIDIGDDLDPVLLPALFNAMGFDLAAVHAADPRAAEIAPDLTSRGDDWLHAAASAAKKTVNDDYQKWRRR